MWPSSTIPARLPLSSFRDVLFRVAGGEDSSRAGRVVHALEAFSLLVYVLSFSIASLPDFRERSSGDFGISSVPYRVLVAVEFSTSVFFLLLFVARLLSVTAVPGRREALTFALETVSDGGEGGGGGAAALLVAADTSGEESVSSDDEDEWAEANTLIGGRGVTPLSGAQLAAVLRSGKLPGVVFHQGHQYEGGGALRCVKRLYAFLTLPATLVDVFSWLPQVMDFAVGVNPTESGNLVLLRALGFARVLRLLRTTAETVAFKILRRSMARAGRVLWVSFVPTMLVVVMMFSCAIFMCEKGAWDGAGAEGPTWYRPDASGAENQPTPFRSVVHAIWFVIVTLSTLGYGDLTPTSPSGKVVATIAISFGLLSIAVPATVVGWHFSSAYQAHLEKERTRARLKRERSRAGWPGVHGTPAPAERAGARPAAGDSDGGSPTMREIHAALKSLRDELREVKEARSVNAP